jgi:5-formyltetrahydrofolate cyclo-ligase
MKNKLRLKAKKNRAKIKLILGKNCLSNIHITYCLDKILSQKPNIKSVALYYPMFDELSPFSFIQYFNLYNLKLALPIVCNQTKNLIFKEWGLKQDLKKGKLGNLEPFENSISILPQVLIVPMLAFDKNLYRIGYGGGYYDKAINKLRVYFNTEKKDFITIGLAYSGQETKSIPYESHDEQLDYIITEKELLSRVNKS